MVVIDILCKQNKQSITLKCGKLSKEMDSKSLAELWKMVIIPRQGKISTHDVYGSFKLRLIPPFFFTYISSFVSEWLLLQIWDEWAENPFTELWMCEGPPGPLYSTTSRSKQIEFDNYLSMLERQEQKNLIKVRRNDREVNHLVVWVVKEVWKD